jgi:hypothetical protein
MSEIENRKKIKRIWNNGVRVYRAMDNAIRSYFIQGQSDYRAGNQQPAGMNKTQHGAWLMGWQADAEVDRRGLQLAPLGLNSGVTDAQKDAAYSL